MLCSSLHHVELCVKDAKKALHLFTKNLAFRVIAERETMSCSQWVVARNDSKFIITERKPSVSYCDFNSNSKYCLGNDSENIANEVSLHEVNSQKFFDKSHSEEEWTVFCCENLKSHCVDSVFNSALVVDNISDIVKRVSAKGGDVVKGPSTIRDINGEVQYCIIGTPIGNAVHTLIDKSKYSGTFLPGFRIFDDDFSDTDDQEINTTHIDHIAYVCEEGESGQIIQWYEEVFGMKRFLLNR